MKNKKGFTLIELLAVVVILAILITITVPTILKALDNSRTAISNINKKNLEDASKQLILEVINCDISASTRNALSQSSTATCTTMQNAVIGKTINITVDKLTTNKYFDDPLKNCSGTVEITTGTNNYKVTVNTSNVTCK